MSIKDFLLSALAALTEALSGAENDVEAFLVGAAQYAAKNIKPAIISAVKDAMIAAEQAYETDASLDKYSFAFSNAVAVLEKDGVAFAESDINYAVEAVIQARNARALQAQVTATDEVDPNVAEVSA